MAAIFAHYIQDVDFPLCRSQKNPFSAMELQAKCAKVVQTHQFRPWRQYHPLGS